MRTVLYANRELSDFLRDSYVLLWTSERPVPKVTIDFGDGRTMERTVTGNAVHYVLDSQGRPLDAIPGLYEPLTFMEIVERACLLHHELKARAPAERERLLSVFHSARSVTVGSAFASALRATEDRTRIETSIRLPRDPERKPESSVDRARSGTAAFKSGDTEFMNRFGGIPAERAVELAIGKSRVEQPILDAFVRYNSSMLGESTDDSTWRKIAYMRFPQATIDSRTLALMARELPKATDTVLGADELARVAQASDPFSAEKAVARAMSKVFGGERLLLESLSPSHRSLATMAAQFVETLAIDTVRNEFTLHAQVHQWFADGDVANLHALNERVYREIFLTPRSDPWLGLMPAAYSGLDAGGARTGP